MSSNTGTTTISSGGGSVSFGTNSGSAEFGSNSGSSAVSSATFGGSAPGVAGPRGPVGAAQTTGTRVIQAPAAGRYYLEFFDAETTIDKVLVLVQGDSATVTYNIRQGANFKGLGTQLFTADRTDVDGATGTILVPGDMVADSNILAANSHLWVDVSAVTADALIIAVFYTPGTVSPLADFGIEVENSESGTAIIPLTDIV